MSTKSREERIRYLLRVARAILVRADALLLGDTEYLRDELTLLLENTDVLLEKMEFEQALLELRNALHGRLDEGDGPEGDGEPGRTGFSEPPLTGIRPVSE
jgi:hypothetical protein